MYPRADSADDGLSGVDAANAELVQDEHESHSDTADQVLRRDDLEEQGDMERPVGGDDRPEAATTGRDKAEEKLRQPIVVEHFRGRAGEVVGVAGDMLPYGYNRYAGLQDPENPYAPFASLVDWKVAEWLKLRGPGSNAGTELLKIPGVSNVLMYGEIVTDFCYLAQRSVRAVLRHCTRAEPEVDRCEAPHITPTVQTRGDQTTGRTIRCILSRCPLVCSSAV